MVEVGCAQGVLVVRDHGPGVADSDIEHIFDRFYRAPEARSRPGSGLGLAIVAQVALDEGGQVSVHHAPRRRGAVPLRPARHPPGAPTRLPSSPPGVSGPSAGAAARGRGGGLKPLFG